MSESVGSGCRNDKWFWGQPWPWRRPEAERGEWGKDCRCPNAFSLLSALCRGPLCSRLPSPLSYSPADTTRLDINASHHVLDHPRHRPQPRVRVRQRVGSWSDSILIPVSFSPLLTTVPTHLPLQTNPNCLKAPVCGFVCILSLICFLFMSEMNSFNVRPRYNILEFSLAIWFLLFFLLLKEGIFPSLLGRLAFSSTQTVYFWRLFRELLTLLELLV